MGGVPLAAAISWRRGCQEQVGHIFWGSWGLMSRASTYHLRPAQVRSHFGLALCHKIRASRFQTNDVQQGAVHLRRSENTQFISGAGAGMGGEIWDVARTHAP